MTITKRLWIPAVLAALALVAGGVFWATSASADLRGDERDRVVAAAEKAVGSGRVVDAEVDDAEPSDPDPLDRIKTYEVEIRKADGTDVTVVLDKDLKVLEQKREDDGADAADADDRVLSATERSRAGAAARDAVGGAGTTAGDVEASDDPGVAYEVDVRTAQGAEWKVDLDRGFAVVQKALDD